MEKDTFFTYARMVFTPGERQPCVVCGKLKSLTQAHHIVPLSVQYKFDFKELIQEHEWLCPNHHAALHIFIGQVMAKNINSSRACTNVINDLSLDELSKILKLLDRFKQLISEINYFPLENNHE